MVKGPRPCSLSGAPCGCARLPMHTFDHPKDTGSTWDSYMLQATSQTATDIGETEGPHTPTATSRCGLPNPLWFMFQSVHWPNGQDVG